MIGIFEKSGERSNEQFSQNKRAKPTCFDDCPGWDFIKHSTTANIPVLSNGDIRLDGTNSECNAAHLAQYLLEKEPSYTCHVECACGYTNTNKYSFLSVNIDIILCEGLSMIQDAIDDCIAVEKSCFNCNKKVPCLNKYGHICDLGYPSRENIVMARLNSITALKTKHYVAYGLTGEYWHKYDGLLKKRSALNPNTTIKPHLIIYAICGS
ncbi:Uncharacterized protein OBRU01_25167 [Operophtera brumata]|uniref:Uncharacterized protein n=1 Tax=Operophtera brumata TaxID=104452 RepID=A0A0L7KFL2_OPEBR|nr:Uncharacterized protein OBRU01_25167 [Operophtera brumata]